LDAEGQLPTNVKCHVAQSTGAQAHIEAILRRRLRHGYRVLAWQ